MVMLQDIDEEVHLDGSSLGSIEGSELSHQVLSVKLTACCFDFLVHLVEIICLSEVSHR